MNKETEVLNVYMEQQQQKIKELTQTIMILETKNKIMAKEIQDLKSINSEYKSQLNDKVVVKNRSGLSEIAASSETPRVALGSKKVMVSGFSVSKQIFKR